MISLGEGLTCGRDPGSSVSKMYQPPFEFTGEILLTTVDVSGELIKDPEHEMKLAMARQ